MFREFYTILDMVMTNPFHFDYENLAIVISCLYVVMYKKLKSLDIIEKTCRDEQGSQFSFQGNFLKLKIIE